MIPRFVRIPSKKKNIYIYIYICLSVSMKMFQEEISIWIHRLSKGEGLQGGWASSNPLRVWIKQKKKVEEERIYSLCLTAKLGYQSSLALEQDLYHHFYWFSGPQTQTVTTSWAFLGFQPADGILWTFLASIIMWVNPHYPMKTYLFQSIYLWSTYFGCFSGEP